MSLPRNLLLVCRAEEAERLRTRVGAHRMEHAWIPPDPEGAELRSRLAEGQFDAALLASCFDDDDHLLRILFAAEAGGAAVFVPAEAAPSSRWIRAIPLADRPLVELRPFELPRGGELAKRVLETALVLAILPLVLPILAILACAVRRDSRGPSLYRQRRLGRRGTAFEIWKLRTMPESAEESSGPVWAREDDPRATPLGRRLRRLGLDELPQLLHVLRGTMALVGPRPERDHFVGRHPALAGRRLLVRPGLTGLAQISLPKDAPPEEKIRYDEWYMRHHSLALDLRICARTAGKFFRRLLREAAGEGAVAAERRSATP